MRREWRVRLPGLRDELVGGGELCSFFDLARDIFVVVGWF